MVSDFILRSNEDRAGPLLQAPDALNVVLLQVQAAQIGQIQPLHHAQTLVAQTQMRQSRSHRLQVADGPQITVDDYAYPLSQSQVNAETVFSLRFVRVKLRSRRQMRSASGAICSYWPKITSILSSC